MQIPEPTHLFELGRKVRFVRGLLLMVAPGHHEVVRCLPTTGTLNGDVFQYMIKANEGGRCRIVREDEITPVM